MHAARRAARAWGALCGARRAGTWAPGAAAAAAEGPPPPAIAKLLVANRGEIACRIFTTARRLGVPTVAVYSAADRGAAHVALADEAFCIGPAPAKDSYLRGDRILEAAARAGATAIHPGYGFLSENAGFAAACEAAGVAFVGPPASAIDAMGDKSRAKAVMAAAGVPVVPGYHGASQDDAFLAEEAARVGFPLLVKAVMGGGGKGMKLAPSATEFPEALASARREAAAAFGDDRVLLERFVEAPRHVEVQILADAHGSAFYLAERDCSVQRRHQKVLEEAPAPGATPAFRAALGASAVAAARAVGYRNAGTVEFIVDSVTGAHYFMEMNTRLQVEHPVTEAVTRVDLVELQLRVAAGEALGAALRQEALEPRGHAVEARLYAENPAKGFLPAGGTVARWRPPPGATAFSFSGGGGGGAPGGLEVRVDSGVREGDAVGVHYDPMIAKVVVRGPDRAAALAGLRAALGALQVAGLPTNAEFVRRVAAQAEFAAGAVDTSFIARHEAELLAPAALDANVAALAAALYAALDAGSVEKNDEKMEKGPWDVADAFRVNYGHRQEVAFEAAGAGAAVAAALRRGADGALEVVAEALGGADAPVRVAALRVGPDWVAAEVNGRLLTADWARHTHGEEEVLDVWPTAAAAAAPPHSQFRRRVVRRWARAGGPAAGAGAAVASPMPGRVVKVHVAVGAAVAEGAPLFAVEAMKMEHAVRAPRAGVVAELHAFEGAQVEEGEVLAVVAGEGGGTPAAAAAG